jgi:hypothetical protein
VLTVSSRRAARTEFRDAPEAETGADGNQKQIGSQDAEPSADFMQTSLDLLGNNEKNR